jgi:Flp pilus assembly secretin CpaC
VSEALTDDADVDARKIEVSVSSGIVTLKGEVDDRRTKRMAEDCADSVSGVSEVINQLRLSKDSEDSGGAKERTLTPARAGEAQSQQPSRSGTSTGKTST